MNVVDLFAGAGGLKSGFINAYEDELEAKTLESITEDCFEKIPSYELIRNYDQTQEEYQAALHCAEKDIIELFKDIYVRNHRSFKYMRGRADTANNVVKALNENGIFISVSTYNNWNRTKECRAIDNDSLGRILELLKISPSNFKRLVFAHIAARREISQNKRKSGMDADYSEWQKHIFLELHNDIHVRVPC